MPKAGVTVYELLISCPGDIKEEIAIIEEVVAEFNRVFGNANNIRVETKHWSKDSYPESGGKPQQLLNKQFVEECDAAIAVLWTRFGTPTDEYGSGTEEEIAKMIDNGKQVFLYFSNKPIFPCEINTQQYKQVIDFKKKYVDAGVYGEYSSNDEFRRLVLNHLSLYFLKLISNQNLKSNEGFIPDLIVKGVNNNRIQDKLYAKKRNYLKTHFILDQEKKIVDFIKKIDAIKIVHVNEVNEEKGIINSIMNNINNNLENGLISKNAIVQNNDSVGDLARLLGSGLNIYEKKLVDVKLSSHELDTISKYISDQYIEVSEAFYYLGGLKENVTFPNINGFIQSGGTYVGSKEEKEKYEYIKEVLICIYKYNAWVQYFGSLSDLYVAEAILSNIGKHYDEDIDIQLKIPKECLVLLEELPVPNEIIITAFCESDLLDVLFKSSTSFEVQAYSDYEVAQYIPPLPGSSYHQQYKYQLTNYHEKLDGIFKYQWYNDEDFIRIIFNVSYLKQNSNVSFPSLIVMKECPANIEYEIRSKYSPNITKGKVEIVVEE